MKPTITRNENDLKNDSFFVPKKEIDFSRKNKKAIAELEESSEQYALLLQEKEYYKEREKKEEKKLVLKNRISQIFGGGT